MRYDNLESAIISVIFVIFFIVLIFLDKEGGRYYESSRFST